MVIPLSDAYGPGSELFDVTLSLDTNAYAGGDVLADTQIITNAVRENGGRATLRSLTVIDKDDQKVALDVWILASGVSMGTENAAPDIDDTEGLQLLGFVPIAAADYKDLGGVAAACIKNVGLVCKAAADARGLYVAVVNGAGTPTYSADGLVMRFGFDLD